MQEGFYENILENTHNGIWVTNKDDVIIYVNNGMEVIAGISRDLIKGKNVLRDFPEETIREFSNYYLKAKQTLSKVQYEATVTTPAKRKTVQDGWLIPITDENEFNGMICSIQDITNRRKAEDELKTRTEELNKLNKVFVGRELRMVELKKEIVELKKSQKV